LAPWLAVQQGTTAGDSVVGAAGGVGEATSEAGVRNEDLRSGLTTVNVAGHDDGTETNLGVDNVDVGDTKVTNSVPSNHTLISNSPGTDTTGLAAGERADIGRPAVVGVRDDVG